MKIFGSKIYNIFWYIGLGWIDLYMRYNIQSCFGKIQKRDVRDENLGV